MYTLNYKTSISCAHSLPDSKSLTTKKCQQLHGHNYDIEVELSVFGLIDGMVMDFGKLKKIIHQLDHKNLNEIMESPTAEIIATFLHNKISKSIPKGTNVEDLIITVSESPNSSITYVPNL